MGRQLDLVKTMEVFKEDTGDLEKLLDRLDTEFKQRYKTGEIDLDTNGYLRDIVLELRAGNYDIAVEMIAYPIEDPVIEKEFSVYRNSFSKILEDVIGSLYKYYK